MKSAIILTESVDEDSVGTVLSMLCRGKWLVNESFFVSNRQSQLIKCLFDLEDVSQAVHIGICARGRESYLEHVINRVPPDHTTSPVAFSYVLRNGAVTQLESRKIKFDHGETLDEFIARSENLLEKIIERFKCGAYKKPVQVKEAYSHCC